MFVIIEQFPPNCFMRFPIEKFSIFRSFSFSLFSHSLARASKLIEIVWYTLSKSLFSLPTIWLHFDAVVIRWRCGRRVRTEEQIKNAHNRNYQYQKKRTSVIIVQLRVVNRKQHEYHFTQNQYMRFKLIRLNSTLFFSLVPAFLGLIDTVSLCMLRTARQMAVPIETE